jgi:hypothetical protein
VRDRCPLRMAFNAKAQYGDWECLGGGCAWWLDNAGLPDGCAVKVLADATQRHTAELLKTAPEL